MKHTPGPWKICRHNHRDGELWLTVVNGAWDLTHNYAKHRDIVADARFSAMSDEENEANARLIAAAPELLEALQKIDKILWEEGLSKSYGRKDYPPPMRPFRLL